MANSGVLTLYIGILRIKYVNKKNFYWDNKGNTVTVLRSGGGGDQWLI